MTPKRDLLALELTRRERVFAVLFYAFLLFLTFLSFLFLRVSFKYNYGPIDILAYAISSERDNTIWARGFDEKIFAKIFIGDKFDSNLEKNNFFIKKEEYNKGGDFWQICMCSKYKNKGDYHRRDLWYVNGVLVRKQHEFYLD